MLISYGISQMSSEARPLLVVATDCRAVACDSIVDILALHSDVPLSVIDLSTSAAHEMEKHQDRENQSARHARPSIANLMASDNGGSAFPLRISNDKEALCDICSATNGCFWDSDLLRQAARTRTGKATGAESPFAADHFFSNRRRPFQINAIQWYTLFALSPLTPTSNAHFGRPPPPFFRRKHTARPRRPSSDGFFAEHTSRSLASPSASRQYHIKSTFSTYVIDPIRILNLLQMRIKEGYRAHQYGARTNDPDRVDILLVLKLDSSTALQYELSYKAIPGHNHMVGSARIIIYLSGEAEFVESVKAEFVQIADPREGCHGSSLPTDMSSRICRMLKLTQEEDTHQSDIVPTAWSNHLVPGAPFIKRLANLSGEQRLLHFRHDQFDCVCVGNMPYNDHTASFLNAFHDADNGENGLFTALREWATQVISWSQETRQPNAMRLLKKLTPTSGGLASYCHVELIQSTSRTYTVSVESFACGGAANRLKVLFSLHEVIRGIKDVHYVEKQISPYLVSLGVHGKDKPLSQADRHRLLLEKQHNHRSWDLMDDHELLPLLIKRRVEIDNFYLLEEKDENYALLARIQPGKEKGDAGDLVQYQIRKDRDGVVVHLHMESEAGVIRGPASSIFWERLVSELESTDKKCGRALSARTTLLSNLDPKEGGAQSADSMITLLPYCSTATLRLPFFHDWSPSANSILKQMLENFLLELEDGVQLARLSVDDREVEGFGEGDWFIAKYDSETMSLVHLSHTTRFDVSNHSGISFGFRELCFCTISISDLYFTRREDVGVEEYISVSALSETIESAHKTLYPMAAYLAIQRDREDANAIHVDDFIGVLRELRWVEIVRVVVERGSTKLASLIKSLLLGVKGEPFHLCYKLDELNHLTADSESKQREVVEVSRPQFQTAASPLLFRFMMDNQPATAKALADIHKSSNVALMVSVRRDHNGPLPVSHQLAGVRLSRLLTSYTAAQTLERLRIHGPDIADNDLRLAKICLKRVMDVETDKVFLSFYISKLDRVIPVRTTNTEEEIENAMRIFDHEMKRSSPLILKASGPRGFLVIRRDEGFMEELPYWCFINIAQEQGVVSLHVWHPSGLQLARRIVSETRDAISQTSHRVNQLLLLHHMHSSRAASMLLVPDEQQENRENDGGPFAPGYFSCPVTFTYSFDLFHMCAANPKQVAAALESTVLHIFGLSNRRGLYVYKDEAGKVLYMYLEAREGEQGSEGSLTLVVRGIDKPNEAVTEQLVRLLTKRLMQLGLDMLSLTVTKNPFRKWKEADISFVQKYAKEWEAIDDSISASRLPATRVYILTQIFDPGMILLYFRQNLCGSTYFQPLVASHEEAASPNSMKFFFNNSPSKLNSELQNQSTLTFQGEEYRQQAGTGLAIIEVSLVDAHDNIVQDWGFGREIPEGWKPTPSPRASEEGFAYMPQSADVSDIRFKVKIEDTALQTDFLHRWTKLTLDQVIAGWAIERHLELSCRDGHHSAVHAVPLLTSLLEESNSIPHPGVRKLESSGIVRSRNLATIAYQTLETAILAPIYKEAGSLPKGFLERYVKIVRKLQESSKAVRFKWRKGEHGDRRASIIRLHDGGDLEDLPIDCPEYAISCIVPGWQKDEQTKVSRPNIPQMFRSVSVQRDEQEVLRGKGMETSPFAFRRSFAFVFLVKRNARCLFTYNWDGSLFDKTRSLFENEDTSFLRSMNAACYRLQRRVLSMLSPKMVTSTQSTAVASAGRSDNVGPGKQVAALSRLSRPIRQPKLIGKSIEGAAAAALAASRARASFKGNPVASSPAQKSRSRAPAAKQPRDESKSRPPRLSKEAVKVAKIQEEVGGRRSSAKTMARRHTLHNCITRAMVKQTFEKGAGPPSEAVANCLLRLFPLSLTLSFRVPPAQDAVTNRLVHSVARSICSEANQFSMVPVLRGAEAEEAQAGVLLTSAPRKVAMSKVFTIVKMEVKRIEVESCLVFQIMTLTMSKNYRKYLHPSKFVQTVAEKDAAGSDVLALAIIPSVLEGSLFDYLTSAAVASLSSGTVLLDELLVRYSFSRQLRALHSGFKVFSMPLKLSSFGNSFITAHSPQVLFDWLKTNESETGASKAGTGCLLIRRDLVVRWTHSYVLLCCNESRLSLTLICRTNGRDLNEFFFPANQCMARTVSSSVGIEAVGIVYHLLVTASLKLQLDSLWRKATQPRSVRKPSEQELCDLIKLGHVESIDRHVNGDVGLLFEALSDDLCPFCQSILQHDRFFPSYKIVRSDESICWMFYFESDSIFLLAHCGADERNVQFSVLSRNRGTNKTKTESVARKLANFLLHQTWCTFLA